MARRNYGQYCALARSLDVIGERWTLLIVRDLLLGPKRFKDLLDGLPGIGRNLLAERLRQLQMEGVVERTTLPPPAASKVYVLTSTGVRLRPVVIELSRWGLHLLDAPRLGDQMRPAWLINTMQGSFRPERARGVHETYEFRVNAEIFHVRIDDGRIDARQGSAAVPDFMFEADLATFLAVGSRQLDPAQAVATGRARFEGDPEAGLRSIEILGPHLGSLEGDGGLLGVLRASFRPELARGVRETYDLRVGSTAFHARIDDGEIAVEPGPADDPAFVMTTDLVTLLGLGVEQNLEEAVASGQVGVEGDYEAARRAVQLFGPQRTVGDRMASAT